ncbi:unnamed protein product, partial [Prorocentrum cordatum]
MAGMGITTETRQRENKAQRDRGTGRTDRVCAGRAPMSGQHAAVRKRALALRAENVATPGERAGRGRGRAAGPRRGAPFLRTERPWAPAAAVPRAAGSTTSSSPAGRSSRRGYSSASSDSSSDSSCETPMRRIRCSRFFL